MGKNPIRNLGKSNSKVKETERDDRNQGDKGSIRNNGMERGEVTLNRTR